MDLKHCLNCDSQINLGQHFCANCGQTTKVHRFTLAHFFHEGFHAFTHADKGLFYLLKELILRPGIVAREYIAGKRKKYYNPFTFFLILAAFYVFSNNFQSSPADHSTQIPKQILQIQNPKAKENAIAQYKRVVKAQNFFRKNGNVIAMIAVPFFAFYFWLIYYRKSYNYSEHLVANLMFVSFANLAFSLIVFPLQAVFKGHAASLITNFGFLLQWFYFVMAYKGFMQLKGFGAMLKVILGTLIGLMLWITITISAMGIYIYQNTHFFEIFKHMWR